MTDEKIQELIDQLQVRAEQRLNELNKTDPIMQSLAGQIIAYTAVLKGSESEPEGSEDAGQSD